MFPIYEFQQYKYDLCLTLSLSLSLSLSPHISIQPPLLPLYGQITENLIFPNKITFALLAIAPYPTPSPPAKKNTTLISHIIFGVFYCFQNSFGMNFDFFKRVQNYKESHSGTPADYR